MDITEVHKQYGDVPLLFSHYYKYLFTFTGVAPDGAVVTINCGGDSDTIYKFSVSRDEPQTLNDLAWDFAYVKKNGNILWEGAGEQ